MDRKLTGVNVNGRNYCIPTRTMVGVCVDGIEPESITHAIKASGHPV
jgi:hypothetical protein